MILVSPMPNNTVWTDFGVGRSPIMSLLPAVVDAANGLPVVAAGGIADGRGLAAAIALGAQAIWLGTRYVAGVEAGLHDGYKQALVEAKAEDLFDSYLFDKGCPNSRHRVVRNHIVTTWELNGCPVPGSRPYEDQIMGHQPDGAAVPRYDFSAPAHGFDGDWAGMALYAGMSVQLIHEILPVQAIVSSLMQSAAKAAAHTVSLFAAN